MDKVVDFGYLVDIIAYSISPRFAAFPRMLPEPTAKASHWQSFLHSDRVQERLEDGWSWAECPTSEAGYSWLASCGDRLWRGGSSGAVEKHDSWLSPCCRLFNRLILFVKQSSLKNSAEIVNLLPIAFFHSIFWVAFF